MGVFLAILTVLFNLWLIPKYGINGAAFATFLAICIYNTMKMVYVKMKFEIQPLTLETIKVFALLVFIGLIFYFLEFSFHPMVNIVLKSVIVLIIYVGVLYRFKISTDIYGVLSKYLKRKTP